MAEHLFKHKTTGAEHLFDQSFAKSTQGEEFDDLGEAINVREDGRNIIKLVADIRKEKGLDKEDQKTSSESKKGESKVDEKVFKEDKKVLKEESK